MEATPEKNSIDQHNATPVASREQPTKQLSSEPQDEMKDKAEGKDSTKPVSEKAKPLWPWLVATVIVLGFVGVVLWLIFVPPAVVETDDARVSVHYTTIAPRISGQVISVKVDDNDAVRTGQLLVKLDPRDYLATVANAQAAMERDEARVSSAAASVQRQPDLIAQVQGNVPSSEARLVVAIANATRYKNLALTGAGTTQNDQQAASVLKQAEQDLIAAKAASQAAHGQLKVLEADQLSAQAQVRLDRAGLEQARLNVSYTGLTAPLDGIVGQRTVQVGDYVSAGTPMMTVIPLQEIYINANYREVALRHVLPGQRVTIHVDAYDFDLEGTVNGIAPASGAVFSSIPPDNATGNFTKIVQRLTVKILVNPNQPQARLLRDGFSVETRIHTNLANVVTDERDRGSSGLPVTAK